MAQRHPSTLHVSGTGALVEFGLAGAAIPKQPMALGPEEFVGTHGEAIQHLPFVVGHVVQGLPADHVRGGTQLRGTAGPPRACVA